MDLKKCWNNFSPSFWPGMFIYFSRILRQPDIRIYVYLVICFYTGGQYKNVILNRYKFLQVGCTKQEKS